MDVIGGIAVPLSNEKRWVLLTVVRAVRKICSVVTKLFYKSLICNNYQGKKKTIQKAVCVCLVRNWHGGRPWGGWHCPGLGALGVGSPSLGQVAAGRNSVL